MEYHLRHRFQQWLRILNCAFLFAFVGATEANAAAWWKNRPLRIYHPNMREAEADNFNVKRFIGECKSLHAEAIVFSTGGIYAFYQTQAPHHVRSPHMEDRDLLKEVIEEARANGIKVIARLDFSKARQELARLHPEWFSLGTDGRPRQTRDGLYQTTMLGGYQNEEFAIPVLREILSGYDVDGFHLNAPGFGGTVFDEATIRKYDIPTEQDAQRRWREQRLASQMKKYRQIIHQSNPEALFMAEINSPESPGWGTSRGFNHELLAEGYTNLLSTAGRPDDEDLYRLRWWVGLTADWSHASKSENSGLPLVNLKVGYHKGKLSLKPIEEYIFYCCQALAHNTGIKAPTYGLLGNMPDPRTSSMITQTFQFMEQCEPYLTSAEPIVPVALVWPSGEDIHGNEESWRDEMLGLYRAMVSRHILFEIVLSNRIPENIGQKYQTIVLPSVTILDESHIASLIAFLKKGGRLILMDAVPDKPMPLAFTRFLRGRWEEKSIESAYAIPQSSVQSGLPGPIMLSGKIRQVVPPDNSRIWYFSSPTPGGSHIPELFPILERGDRAVVYSTKIGTGELVYFAGGLGTMMWKNDLPDYSTILEKMIYPDSPELQTLTTDAPTTVNIAAYRIESGITVHLVNGTGKTPLDRIVPVGPIRIRLHGIAGRQVKWYTPGQESELLECRSRSGYIEATIPKLGTYGLMVVEE
ncbi:MAG: family 10 glycosylhydrolase [Phycisphaerales bacterium]|nr:MAG: family 10 glycosylhydrolase [Phycisphaerales bacterium]